MHSVLFCLACFVLQFLGLDLWSLLPFSSYDNGQGYQPAIHITQALFAP